MDDFITIDQLTAFMGVEDLDETQALLAIAASQQAIRNYMQQDITLVEDRVEYPTVPWGYRRFRLRQRPVRAISSITVDGEELTAGDDWRLEKSKVILTDAPYSGEVVTTYDSGWDVPADDADDPVPADIVRIALTVARRAYIGMGQGDELPMRSETIGSYSYTVATTTVATGSQMTESELETLDWYVIRLAV